MVASSTAEGAWQVPQHVVYACEMKPSGDGGNRIPFCRLRQARCLWCIHSWDCWDREYEVVRRRPSTTVVGPMLYRYAWLTSTDYCFLVFFIFPSLSTDSNYYDIQFRPRIQASIYDLNTVCFLLLFEAKNTQLNNDNKKMF